MMRLREAGLFGCAGALAFVAPACLAQASITTPGAYRPKILVQSPPLRVEVIDGVRFRDIETKAVFRLYGVDACGPGQFAALGRQRWPCGVMATAWLVTATLNKWLACAVIREERGERLARCATAGHPDIAADMLREGVAVLAPATQADPTIPAYALAEQQARKAWRGLWSSAFQTPWEWRRNHRDKLPAAVLDEAAR